MKILEITSELDGGGVDRLLYDYCSRMSPNIHFDYVVTSDFKGILEDPLERIGSSVYHLPPFRKQPLVHIRRLKQLYTANNYDIIHDHSGYKSFLSLIIALICGVKVRIAHSHQADIPESFINWLIRKFCTFITVIVATDLFACGENAAIWMWGRSRRKRVHIMTNAIEVDKFRFSNETRSRYRKMFDVEDKIVLGNVARFSHQKNHEFLLKMFREYHTIVPNSVLLLVGRGELFEDTKLLADRLNIADSVIFLGVRDDVSNILNAMDLFVLPSFHEGLPVTLVEVEANGLASVVSDSVTGEMKINRNVYYYPLHIGAKQWAINITKINSFNRDSSSFDTSDYNIEIASPKMKKFYLDKKH